MEKTIQENLYEERRKNYVLSCEIERMKKEIEILKKILKDVESDLFDLQEQSRVM